MCRIPLRRIFAAVLCALPLAAAAAPPDTLAQRLRACTACHDDQGRQGTDAYYPRIAGKPYEYLYNQLRHFRDGRRHYPLMEGLLAHLSDEYLLTIARHFAALDVPYPPPEDNELSAEAATRARALVYEGDERRELPPCAACHDKALMGVQPAVPGLLGLPTDYIRAQLGAWRSGTRKAAAPDCMAEIARKLTPEEISVVSAWLSAQPAPAHGRPAARGGKPPMACGSVLDAEQGTAR
ncbi:MAG: c-type cytochrome [Burkholderiales bacterium]|nr:c-type cytochrome [Burkholderiales bacterium]